MQLHTVPLQRSLFKIPPGPSAVLFSLSDESFPSFLNLIRNELPSAVIDLRVSPRFDFGDFGRDRVLPYMSSLGISYIDPALDLPIADQHGREVAMLAAASFTEAGRNLVVLLLAAGERQRQIANTIRQAFAAAAVRCAILEMP